jgi:hypothetical protein
MSPMERYKLGNWTLGEGMNLGGCVTYYLPPRLVVVDVRIDVLPSFQPVVHQHRSQIVLEGRSVSHK